MQSTIKSTLSLLISLAQATGAEAQVKGDTDRSATLDPQTNICSQRLLLSSFSALTRGWGECEKVDKAMRRKDKALDGSLSTPGFLFTTLKVSLINQDRWKKLRTGIRKDKDARLACEHRSMTSSTTELLDFIHTRPGEDKRKQALNKFFGVFYFIKLYVSLEHTCT